MLDDRGLIAAASSCLPDDARVSHLTAFRLVGLDYGPLLPLHFTIPRDLHLHIDDVFLHRTVAMPPRGPTAVTTEAAFVGAASFLRLIDLIKVGDWLVHRGHLDPARLASFATEDDWRPGAETAIAVAPLLSSRSRSLKESELRVVLTFAGLPVPGVNVPITENGQLLGIADLVYLMWRLIIEYEGRQHALDIAQFDRDIHRYAGFREHDWAYLQVTNEMLRRPQQLVNHVHRLLRARGYDGPAPEFGAHWASLFATPDPRAVRFQPNPASRR